MPLRDDERRNLLLKILPSGMKLHIIERMHDFKTWEAFKDHVKERARG